jgi:starvation-inducible DNA-binding protein
MHFFEENPMKNNVTTLTKKNTQVIDGLAQLLADSYLLYLKTQNFHWNVTGENFVSLHKLFEEQYLALAAAVDEIAERMRALHTWAPGSFSQFLKLASLEESQGHLSADKMVRALLHDHECIAKTIASLFPMLEESNDEVTLDLFIARKSEHDKTAWMLRSILGNH